MSAPEQSVHPEQAVQPEQAGQDAQHPAQQALAALAEGGVEFDVQALLRSAPASPLSKEAAVLILFGVLDNSPSTGEFEGCPENVSADLDVLLLVRAATLRSHAGQPAFPGGKIDPEDYALAETTGEPVAHIAALREAVEETGLDPSGVQEVRDSILTAAEATGATLLVVEHRVSIWAPHMDRIIVLGEGGTITHDGAPDTVLTEARQELIDAGVWVPNYVPRAPQSDSDSKHGEALLRAENLSITRAQPTPKQRRARRRTIKRLGDTPAPAPTDLPVLRGGINLTLHAGEHLSVLGPNGAGKSTLALTLAGLLTAPDGTLAATDTLRDHGAGQNGQNGQRAHWDVPTWTPAQMLSRIGYVFQEPEYQFIRGTVREELELGPRRLAALNRVPLDEDELAARTDDLAARLRLNHLLDANPFTLSGGEKRRLSVASALATAPRILILDEPTFGQDARTWAELVDLIRELLADGTAVISITHDEDYTAALGGKSITLEALEASEPSGPQAASGKENE